MTLKMEREADATSIGGEAPPFQLPAYSETDEHSNAGFEVVDGPYTPPSPTFMTAEQEKAYLATRDQSEAPRNNQASGLSSEPHYATQQVPVHVHEQFGQGGLAANGLARGLQVPSCRRKVTSGFPYPDMLSQHGISAEEWSRFTSEITKAAQLTSKDWTVTVGAGVATFCASGIFLGWLGLIPAWVVGHHLRRLAENKNLRTARDVGDLESKVLQWNQTTFAPRGFLVRLDLPGDWAGDLDRMDVFRPKKRGAWGGCGSRCGDRSRGARKAEKQIQCIKMRTAKRGRIVIVPLNTITRAVPESSGVEDTVRNENAVVYSEKDVYADTTREA